MSAQVLDCRREKMNRVFSGTKWVIDDRIFLCSVLHAVIFLSWSVL